MPTKRPPDAPNSSKKVIPLSSRRSTSRSSQSTIANKRSGSPPHKHRLALLPAKAPQHDAGGAGSSPTETFELTIEKLVYGGDGLGRRPEGEVLFVPWSVPGDRLRVFKEPGNQKPVRAGVEAVLSASPDRIEPQCEAFGVCGGCQWQQMTPAYQRDWKRKIVEESLQRIGKLENVTVSDVIGSDDNAWRYRNRVQWDIAPAGDTWNDITRYRLGYCQSQSHEVIEFTDCLIMPEPLNKLALWLRDILQQTPELTSGLLRIEAFCNQAGDILLSFHGEKHGGFRKLAETIRADFTDVVGVVHFDSAIKYAKGRILSGVGFLTEDLAGRRFRVSAGSFFQTNAQGAQAIIQQLQQWMPQETESLLDLYAGVGTFALCLQNHAQRIVAIESSETAMADAQDNIRRSNAQHITLKTGDARRVLSALQEDFDAAILDPPRAGCTPEVLQWLSQHVKTRLLYVSCNPTTLARDLKLLTAQGWQIQAVQPIDMFPQTYHVETVVHLTRA